MRWHILGAGAIGCLFAARLADAGLDVCLILRSAKQLDQFQQQGQRLRLQTPQGPREIGLNAEQAQADGMISHLLVTTKAYDSEVAIASVRQRLAPKAQIVLLQNGLGYQQTLAEQLAPRPVWAAITTCGAHRPAPFAITLAGDGVTQLGRIDAYPASSLPEGWKQLGPDVIQSPDIKRALWQKLAINAAINPLTALHDCRNGALLNDPKLYQQLIPLCQEIEQIAAACGQALFDEPLLQAVSRVAEATAANFSSMLQDRRAGRRTEIDQISGFLCQQARLADVAAPLNRALLSAIRNSAPTHYTGRNL